jgi:hypothetical protein
MYSRADEYRLKRILRLGRLRLRGPCGLKVFEMALRFPYDTHPWDDIFSAVAVEHQHRHLAEVATPQCFRQSVFAQPRP